MKNTWWWIADYKVARLPLESQSNDNEEQDDSDEEEELPKPKTGGYTLEFDAAARLPKGPGIDLERSESIVEVKGDKARLLPVSERTRYLFGKNEESAVVAKGKRRKPSSNARCSRNSILWKPKRTAGREVTASSRRLAKRSSTACIKP